SRTCASSATYLTVAVVMRTFRSAGLRCQPPHHGIRQGRLVPAAGVLADPNDYQIVRGDDVHPLLVPAVEVAHAAGRERLVAVFGAAALVAEPDLVAVVGLKRRRRGHGGDPSGRHGLAVAHP